MMQSIRDMLFGLFMLGWEILIIIMAFKRYDYSLGMFGQANDYYVLVTALCIFSVVFDYHIEASHKRVDAL